MKYFLGFILIIGLAVPTFGQLSFEEFASGFFNPVDIAHAGDGSGRVFIVTKAGQILSFDEEGNALGTFLDIGSKVGNSGGERGLLGLAFHPNYASNGYFFVNYTSSSGGDKTIIERYQANPPSTNDVLETTGVELIRFSQPYTNHNGGDLAFSPIDGYLYIPTGDGGDGNDPDERAQNLTSPHGKMLRIDVNHFDETPPYRIPDDNPFGTSKYISEYQDTVDEIWAWGLRNPWRMSFSEAGDMWIADVGQNSWEEVNFIPVGENVPGLNFGWDCKEGSADCPTCGPGDCSDNVYWDPIHQYNLARQSITGGEVMEGTLYPSMPGGYLFAEYVHDQMWVLQQAAEGNSRTASIIELSNPPSSVSSFGKDEQGYIYVASMGNDKVYRLVDQGALPIEIIGVQIERQEEINILKWETSFESNASHFEIERSRGQNDFKQIGIVPTKGRHSEDGATYFFQDPVSKEGHYYYRLKSIDQDGSYDYSLILNISVTTFDDIRLTPNPATSQVMITIPKLYEPGELKLIDISGKLLFQKAVHPSDNYQDMTIDVSGFSRGVVLVQLSTARQEQSKKLMLYR